MIHSLLEILRCPDCDSGVLKLEQGRQDAGEVVSGRLYCVNCQEHYPIEEGIPCLLPERLRKINMREREEWVQRYKEIENRLVDSDKDTFRKGFMGFARQAGLDEERMAFVWEHRLFQEYENQKARNAPLEKVGLKLTRSEAVEAHRNTRFLTLVGHGEKDLRGKRALNIGPGNDDDLVTRLENNGPITIHCDLVLDSLRTLRRSNRTRHLVCGDARSLPFRDEVFDLVFCVGSLHHIHPIEQPLREAYRVLGKEGGIYIHELNADCLLTLPGRVFPKGMRKMERKFVRILFKTKERLIKASPYEKIMRREEVMQALRRAGFQVERIEIFDQANPNLPSFVAWLWEKGTALSPSLLEPLANSYMYHALKEHPPDWNSPQRCAD